MSRFFGEWRMCYFALDDSCLKEGDRGACAGIEYSLGQLLGGLEGRFFSFAVSLSGVGGSMERPALLSTIRV